MGEEQDTVSIIHQQFTRIKLLTSDLHIKDQTINILQDKVQDQEDQLIQSQRSRENIERQFHLLQEEHNAMFEQSSKKTKSLQEFNQQLLLALKEVQDKNQSLLEQLQQQDNEIQHQENGKLEIQEQLVLLKQGVSGLEKDLQLSMKKNQSLKKENQTLSEENKKLSSNKENLALKDEKIKSIFDRYEQDQKTQKLEIDDLKNNNKSLNTELNELRQIRRSYQELSEKYEETLQSYNLHCESSKQNEKIYIEKLEELSDIQKECEKQKKQCFQENKNISQQNQGLQDKLSNQSQFIFEQHQYLQQQMQSFQENIIAQNQSKQLSNNIILKRHSVSSSVFDRLYEDSSKHKKSSKRNDSIKKTQSNSKQKKTLEQPVITNNQLSDFFKQLETTFQDYQEREQSSLNEIDQLKHTISQLGQQNQSFKIQIDELTNLNNQMLQETQKKYEIQIEQLESDSKDGWQLFNQECEKQKKFQQVHEEQKDLINQLEKQLLQSEEECLQIKENNNQLNQEFESLQVVFRQVQFDVEDLMAKKSISQNKLCLAYGFIQKLFKMIELKEHQELLPLSNYIYYFASIQESLKKPSKVKREHIYQRFKKLKNVLRFVKYLKSCKKLGCSTTKQLSLSEKVGVSFSLSQQIDNVVEQFIPTFQQSNDQAQTKINAKLSEQLFQEMIKLLSVKEQSKQRSYFPIQQKIVKSSQKDSQIILEMVFQSKYYEDELTNLQSRVVQLDQFINTLQNELTKLQNFEAQLKTENQNLLNENILLKQTVTLKESQESSQHRFSTPIIQPEVSKFQQQVQKEPVNLSTALQKELIDILNKRQSTLSLVGSMEQSRINSDKQRGIGRIIRQPITEYK